MPGPILIAGQVETLQLKLRTKTYAQSNFHCRTSGNFTTTLRTETCARSNSHFRISGNLMATLRTKTCARSNSHCRTGGNLTTKIKERNLCSVQFSLSDRLKPYYETKGKGSSPDKLNTTTFLIVSTTSSQVPESVAFRYC